VFTNKAPSREEFQKKFEDIDAFGLYLHIPFCEQICPYCPNDRGIYRDDTSVSGYRLFPDGHLTHWAD
jgi:coproporphyrinogen III oxidase-like Fe-S oxidoreductase